MAAPFLLFSFLQIDPRAGFCLKRSEKCVQWDLLYEQVSFNYSWIFLFSHLRCRDLQNALIMSSISLGGKKISPCSHCCLELAGVFSTLLLWKRLFAEAQARTDLLSVTLLPAPLPALLPALGHGKC